MKSQAYQDDDPWTFHVTIDADDGRRDNSKGLGCRVVEKNADRDFRDASLSTITTSSASLSPSPSPTTTTNKEDHHHVISMSSTFANDRSSHPLLVPAKKIESFRTNGFVVFRHVLSSKLVSQLNDELEEILRGRYNRGRPPDKAPKLIKSSKTIHSTRRTTTKQRKPKAERERELSRPIDNISDEKEECSENHRKETNGVMGSPESKDTCSVQQPNQEERPPPIPAAPLGFSGNHQNVKVLQLINVHKANDLFRQIATSPVLGQVVARLAGWTAAEYGGGTRLAQDQVWAKPPSAPPLSFHRDSPYFMFTPHTQEVVTVWIALDTMHEELGPLQYVCGSHLWGQGRCGTSNQFFDSKNGGLSLIQSAARRQGLPEPVVDHLQVVRLEGLEAGGLSIHHGQLWHGSGANTSRTQPRRGWGIHFVPARVTGFLPSAAKSRLWSKHYADQLRKQQEEEQNEVKDRMGDARQIDGGGGSTRMTRLTSADLDPQDFPITWSCNCRE